MALTSAPSVLLRCLPSLGLVEEDDVAHLLCHGYRLPEAEATAVVVRVGAGTRHASVPVLLVIYNHVAVCLVAVVAMLMDIFLDLHGDISYVHGFGDIGVRRRWRRRACSIPGSGLRVDHLRVLVQVPL